MTALDTQPGRAASFGIMHCLGVSIAVLEYRGQKQLQEERVYLSLHGHVTVHTQRSQGRNSRQITGGSS